MANTDLAIPASQLTGARADIAAFQAGNVPIFSTVPGTSFEDKQKTLKATTNSERLKEVLGQTLSLEHFILQAVTLSDNAEADPETGEVSEGAEVVRAILLTKEGKAYHAISNGVLKSLQNIYGMLGEPSSWPEPVKVKPVLQQGRNGFEFMTLKLV